MASSRKSSGPGSINGREKKAEIILVKTRDNNDEPGYDIFLKIGSLTESFVQNTKRKQWEQVSEEFLGSFVLNFINKSIFRSMPEVKIIRVQ